MLHRSCDNLLDLLIRDGGLRSDGVDRAAGLDSLEQCSGAGHGGTR